MVRTPLLCDSPLLLVIPQVEVGNTVKLGRLASFIPYAILSLWSPPTEPHHGRDLINDACLVKPLPCWVKLFKQKRRIGTPQPLLRRRPGENKLVVRRLVVQIVEGCIVYIQSGTVGVCMVCAQPEYRACIRVYAVLLRFGPSTSPGATITTREFQLKDIHSFNLQIHGSH